MSAPHAVEWRYAAAGLGWGVAVGAATGLLWAYATYGLIETSSGPASPPRQAGHGPDRRADAEAQHQRARRRQKVAARESSHGKAP